MTFEIFGGLPPVIKFMGFWTKIFGGFWANTDNKISGLQSRLVE